MGSATYNLIEGLTFQRPAGRVRRWLGTPGYWSSQVTQTRLLHFGLSLQKGGGGLASLDTEHTTRLRASGLQILTTGWSRCSGFVIAGLF
jgi:hypothetical protein